MNSMKPATSRNTGCPVTGSWDAPAVATGTSSVTLTVWSSLPTRTELRLRLTVCVLPAAPVLATVKIASLLPLLRSTMSFVMWKLALSSAKPKLSAVSNGVLVRATTSVTVERAGWTSPVPPRLIW